MNYKNFDIDLFDEDNDPNHKNSLLSIEKTLQKFVINYELSSIPTIELTIMTADVTKFIDIKNMYAHVVIEENIKDYNFCISNYKYADRVVTLYGYLCSYDDYSQIQSTYLGDSFINCIRALKVKKNLKINGSNGYANTFTDDFSLDYWQIQETNAQSITKILKMANKESIFTMDNDTIYINTIDFKKAYKHNSIAPDELMYIAKSENIKSNNEQIKEIDYSYNDTEGSTLSMFSTMSRLIISDKNNETAMVNYATSIPLVNYLGDFLIKCIYKLHYVPLEIGESMKSIDINIPTSTSWYVIGKVEKYTMDAGLTTAILFSCE